MFEKNQTVIFEGDSLTKRGAPPHHNTWPYLRLMKWERTWADAFEELLFAWHPELNLKTVNNAAGGSNIKGMMERLDRLPVSAKPDWIIATIGNNDPHQGISVIEFETLVRGYVEKARCKLLFLGGFKPPGNPSVPYCEVLARVAGETGNHYLDAGGALREKQAVFHALNEIHTVYSDGAHLNELGSLVVAGEVLKFFFPNPPRAPVSS